jgi:hypothetical protein
MKGNLRADYARAMEDKELLSLRHEVATLEAMQCDQLRKMRDAVPKWTGKDRRVLLGLIKAKVRVVMAEHRRLMSITAVITAERAMATSAAVRAVVRDVLLPDNALACGEIIRRLDLIDGGDYSRPPRRYRTSRSDFGK